MASHPFRLILDPPRPASLNMAIDEMLLERQAGEPCLRIYGWESACYTLGYFQDLKKIAGRRALRPGLQAVRRLTGGGLVEHGRDLTFSLVLPTPSPFFSGDVKESYLKINEALVAGLRALYASLDFADCKTVPSGRAQGERVCFTSPSCYDLLLKGRKVVGSSQRRIGQALLHQCSVFLDAGQDALSRCVREGFALKWGAGFSERALSGDEIARAEAIEACRYASEEWALPPAARPAYSFSVL